MNTVRTLALAAVAEASAAAKAMHNGTPQGEVIEMLPRVVARDDTCTELPKLCTGPAMLYGYATTVTYLCPDTTAAHEPSTVHVTITKTTTVTPPEVEVTDALSGTPDLVAPAPTLTEEPATTTTIRSTSTQYKTITLDRNSGAPLDVATRPALAVLITGYLSATMPTELLSTAAPLALIVDPIYTIQTSTRPPATSTPGYGFPTMSLPVVNNTTAGIAYSAPVANSSLVQPTPFFPNTTSTHSHYAIPTLDIANKAPEDVINNGAGTVVASLVAVVFSMMTVALSV